MKSKKCAKCEFAESKILDQSCEELLRNGEQNILTGICLSKDAPTTNFMTGKKECKNINKDGKCKYYKGCK